MGKKKIVLDTNILVSSISWKGNPRKVFDKCEKGDIELITSLKQFYEFCRVLEYPKFDFSDEQKNKFKNLILKIATFVEPQEKVDVVKEDPNDNMLLECATESKAYFIITGDKHLLKLKEFKGIKIITAKEFLEILNREKG